MADDFSTKKKKPEAKEYLEATELQLLERLNNDPCSITDKSEFPFIQSVIAIRTAENHKKTNEELVKQTQLLVYATWAVCLATILAVIFTVIFKK
jgi:dynactin complex subunit